MIPVHLLLAELRSPAPLGWLDMEMPRSLRFDNLPPVSVLHLHFQKGCAPQTRLKQHRQNLQPRCFMSVETCTLPWSLQRHVQPPQLSLSLQRKHCLK